jgi:hypothetical protein
VIYLSGVAVVGVLSFFSATPAEAQRPVQTFDPFYKGESANRSFFDRYAITAELSYRPSGLLQNDDPASGGLPGGATEAFGMNLRFEYRLSSQLDLGFYVDAAGNTAGRSLSLNWLSLKYFRREEGIDYAVRLAVDPVSDGRSGFPQMDLAFLYRSFVSRTVTSDFAVGIRRVQLGFQQFVTLPAEPIDASDPIVSAPAPDRDILRSRALGWEVHMLTGYNLIFDPAGSNMFVTLIGEGGSYDLVEWMVSQGDPNAAVRNTTAFKGGVLWIRSGLQIERPGYRFSPFIRLPVKQWSPSDGDFPRARPRFGLQFMIR